MSLFDHTIFQGTARMSGRRRLLSLSFLKKQNHCNSGIIKLRLQANRVISWSYMYEWIMQLEIFQSVVKKNYSFQVHRELSVSKFATTKDRISRMESLRNNTIFSNVTEFQACNLPCSGMESSGVIHETIYSETPSNSIQKVKRVTIKNVRPRSNFFL